MTHDTFRAVDDYFLATIISEDQALQQAQADALSAGLPLISVSPPQGKLLQLLVQMIGATRVLEIGTLAGYSAIWMARGLPNVGRLTTIEYEPTHAEVARKNFARAGVADKIDLRLGDARQLLPKLHDERAGPFDLVFIDADKSSTPEYFAWALKLTRPGSVIVVDNVVRNGRVIDADSTDASVQGIRTFNQQIAANPRVSATAIQTVGAKGYDGFALVRVLS